MRDGSTGRLCVAKNPGQEKVANCSVYGGSTAVIAIVILRFADSFTSHAPC